MKNLKLTFALVWVALTVAGALNHTLVRGFLAPTGLYHVLPNLRYGYVMFNRNPVEIPVISYRTAAGEWKNVKELVATPAPFYKTTRTAVNVWIDAEYLVHLCRVQPQAETLFKADFYQSPGQAPVDTRLMPCENGVLRGL